MKLSRITTYYIFCALLFWTLTIRSVYIAPHGGDTWSHLVRTSSVTENGYVGWFIHPLSFFGWYTISYPAGVFVLMSALIQITGFEPTTAVQFFSFFTAISVILPQFIFSRLLFRNDGRVFLSMFVSSTMLSMVSLTWSILSPRIFFLFIFPLVIYFLFKVRKDSANSFSSYICIIIMILTLASLHRIILFFFICVIFPFLISSIINRFYSLKIFFNKKRNIYPLVIIFLVLFMLSNPFQKGLEKHVIILVSEVPFSPLINLVATYGTWYGPFFVLMPFGFIAILNKQSKRSPDIFIIFVCLIGMFYVVSPYFILFFTPFAPILAVMGFRTLEEMGQSTKRVLILSLITLAWIPNFLSYIDHQWYGLLVISLFGLYIFLNNLKGAVKQKPFKSRHIFYQSWGVAIISAITIFAGVPMKALDEHHDPYPQSGRLVEEAQTYGRSHWMEQYSQGDFLANHGGERNTIGAISGVGYTADFIDISDDLLLLDIMEPVFNFSLLWTSGQKVFDTDFSSRYNPKMVTNEIFRGDYNLANSHQVNIFVIRTSLDDSCPRPDSCYREDKMVQILEDSRYVVFIDLKLRMYHYM